MKCYAAFAKDKILRMKGSSGGIFPVMSQHHIKEGGIVYASVYDENFNVVFSRICDLEQLEKSFTSKYLQSRLNNTFEDVARDLKAGQNILFCGTPCQCSGLKLYLHKKKIDMQSLLVVDIICHGVPSEDVFHKYMSRYMEPRCVSLNMRNKETGWNWGDYAWKITFSDGSEMVSKQRQISYMKGFLSNLYLRPSCYECVAKNSSCADVTLGDFWGISNVNDTIPAELGVSCMIARTMKGEKILEEQSFEIKKWEVTLDDILFGNRALLKSPKRPFNRQKFFREINRITNREIDELIDNMSKQTTAYRVINKLYSKMPRIGTNVGDLLDGDERLMYLKKEKCCGCSACYSICPTKAISMRKDVEGFFYPIIDKNKCVGCRMCEEVCLFTT